MKKSTLTGIIFVAILALVSITLSTNIGHFSPSNLPLNNTIGNEKVLTIGTTNIVKTDNFIKDYYMGIFAACFTLDPLAAVDQGGNIIPYLVNWSTTYSKNWELILIRNATWHDGMPVTAED